MYNITGIKYKRIVLLVPAKTSRWQQTLGRTSMTIASIREMLQIKIRSNLIDDTKVTTILNIISFID
jgi:hypothetical protein